MTETSQINLIAELTVDADAIYTRAVFAAHQYHAVHRNDCRLTTALALATRLHDGMRAAIARQLILQ